MVQQIVIEAEPPGGAQSMFRLSIDANLIAKGVTVAQACSGPQRRNSFEHFRD